ncbi:acyl-CoA thioesterase [Sedimentisphaera salicampi]|uniref:Acyl-CoA thioester hydrolase YbgC n=1 Tax=Sedimentisphaera salicampi TaxID=1941349 RepID=A0A1W6LPT0_9BACT|nr:thioesterase family protein [Sedimentisphaera salicampi]ARN57733.1 Acyl-CoA thioester hydrolase YbgC [Sedimentisphaera salicampi]OXU14291.1 Acyl-CoA thioester hydrolase YbgC [Sedimentisphaera salicampi]
MTKRKLQNSICETQIIPRYSETDQGGIVHNSVYSIYFEIGRTELLRENGMAYSFLEENNCRMVVAEIQVKFRKPAYYDQKLTLRTECTNVTKAKIEHTYTLFRDDTKVTVAEGKTIVACVDGEGKPVKIPDFLYPAD